MGLSKYANLSKKGAIQYEKTVFLIIRTGDKRYIKREGVSEEINVVALITDKYCTSRGLKVGDSLERCYDLYGVDPSFYGNLITGFLNVEFDDDCIVTRIICYSAD